jgi:pyridoxamine 5'-phosphate oxidase family protein
MLSTAQIEYLASQRLGRLATAGADNDVEARLQGPAASLRVAGGRGGLTGWAAIVVDDLVSVDHWRARFLEIRGRAEAIPSGGAHLGPGFGEAFIRIHPEKVNSYGIE